MSPVLVTVTSKVMVPLLSEMGEETPAVSQFGYAQGDVTYLSRKDGFANYDDAVAAPTDFEMAADVKAGFYNHTNYDPTQFNNDGDAVPTTGAKNGLTLM